MNFKLILFLIFITTGVQANSFESYPLGIILRPSLFQRYFDALEKRKEGINFSICKQDIDIGISGSIGMKLSDPKWLNSSAQGIHLSAQLNQMSVNLLASSPCAKNAIDTSKSGVQLNFNFKTQKKIYLQVFLNPWNIHLEEVGQPSAVFTDDSLQDFAEAVEIQMTGDYPQINKELESLSFRKFFVKAVVEVLQKEMHVWLGQRLRGLAYVDYLSNMFESNANWKEGVQIEKGAISLTNPGARLRQSDLAFGFYPRREQFVIPGEKSLELYFNAVFLDQEQMHGLTGDSDRARNLALARDRLLFDSELKDSPFERPLVANQDSDASLILPESLINGALTRLYQQDLRQFTTTIAFGEQAEGVITKEKTDVSIRVELESHEAPKILFESNQFNLSVSNYFLSIGTFIEDRLIPSTQVKAEVDISAGFDISDSHVNLSVEPKTFNIKLDKGHRFKNRFSKEDLNFVENISNQLWREFFAKYPRLPLFYTIFKTQENSGSKIQITKIKVQNKMILIHFNFEDLEVKL